MMTKFSVFALSLCIAAPGFTQVEIGGDEVFAERTLAETLVTVEALSRFAEAAEASGLMETLRAEGPMTLIAPRNAAFPPRSADAPKQADLLTEETGEALAAQIACHVIPEKLEASGLSAEKETAIQTLGSCVLTIRDGVLYGPDDAVIRLSPTDLAQENGVLHATDDLIALPE